MYIPADLIEIYPHMKYQLPTINTCRSWDSTLAKNLNLEFGRMDGCHTCQLSPSLYWAAPPLSPSLFCQKWPNLQIVRDLPIFCWILKIFPLNHINFQISPPLKLLYICSDFFTSWGLVPAPEELGKKAAFSHKLGKIVWRDLVKKVYFESSILSNSNISCFHFPFHETFFFSYSLFPFF